MNRYFNLRHFIIGLALGLLAAGGAQAAVCTLSNNGVFNPATTAVSFGTVAVARDASVGANIGAPITSVIHVECPSVNSPNGDYSFYLQNAPGPGVAVANTGGVWPTGKAGVGIKITNVNENRTVTTPWTKDEFAAKVPENTVYKADITFQYQLVKTGLIAAGPLTITQLLSLNSHDAPQSSTPYDSTLLWIGINNTTITVPTCTVTTNPIKVELPPLGTNKLSAVGAAAGDTDFQIDLGCGSNAVNVYITMTDAADSTNQSELLTLSSDSTAQGVKLRLTRTGGGGPVYYGPDSPLPGTPNQWLVGPAATTSAIPLRVQYVATDPVVTPGIVKASATFTLSYQ